MTLVSAATTQLGELENLTTLTPELALRSEGTAISLHLYGPRVGEIDGRDYDPSRDYVCDRGVA